VVNSRLQIAGTAPVAALVSITITDIDLFRSNIAHQPTGRVDGSVTSDAAGQWVFVPEVHITQGLFEARASFAGPQGQAVESAAVQFVVVNQAGQSEVPASSLKWQVGIVLVILALLGAAVIAVFVRRRRLRRDEGLHRVHHRRRRHGRDRSQSPRALADDPAPRTSRPLFMSTDQGRSYQRDQAHKMHAMDDEMQAIERALADTAEALDGLGNGSQLGVGRSPRP